MADTRQQQDDAKGGQRGQHIGDGIKHRRTVGGFGIELIAVDHAGQQGQQQKTHLGNGGKRQHAFQVGLCNRRQITHQQRADGHQPEHLLPVDCQRKHALHQQADADGKCRQLRRRTNQQRDGCGRALIHIRQPHVKRHRPQLESQAGNDENQAEHQHLVIHLAAGNGFVHLIDVQ